jgi:hypothetical protein
VRTEFLAAVCALLLAGCATDPGRAPKPPSPAVATACTPAGAPSARTDLCDYPADVRAFIEDRDLCDHFRGEPWPTGDSEPDRARRRELVEGVRTACAGTDARLAALKERYVNDGRISALLGRFEAKVGD